MIRSALASIAPLLNLSWLVFGFGLAHGLKSLSHEWLDSRWWDWSAIVSGTITALLWFVTYLNPLQPLAWTAYRAICLGSGLAFAVIFYSQFLEELTDWYRAPEDLAPFDQRVRGTYYNRQESES